VKQALPVNQLNLEDLCTILNLIENGSEETETLRGISSVTSDHDINAILNCLANSGLIIPPET
jgi:hypothetical protein